MKANRAAKLAEAFRFKLDNAVRQDAKVMLADGRDIASVARFLQGASKASKIATEVSDIVFASTPKEYMEE